MSESTLKSKICKQAQKVSSLKLVRRMTAGNNAGEPDIFGCFNGKHVEIEVKVDKNTPTKLQVSRLEEWSEFTPIVGCVWSLRDVFELLCDFVVSEEQYDQLRKAYFRDNEDVGLKKYERK